MTKDQFFAKFAKSAAAQNLPVTLQFKERQRMDAVAGKFITWL